MKELRRWFRLSPVPHDTVPFDSLGDVLDIALCQFLPDYRRYFADAPAVDFDTVNLWPTLQNTFLHRIAHQMFQRRDEDLALRFATLGRFLSGIEIYYSAVIGTAFKVHHGLGTVVGARCRVGDNVTLYQGVTLGERAGRPTIGNNVVVYAGSQILGPITIGDNAIIGAHSLCLYDVPANAVYAGVPARLVKARP